MFVICPSSEYLNYICLVVKQESLAYSHREHARKSTQYASLNILKTCTFVEMSIYETLLIKE